MAAESTLAITEYFLSLQGEGLRTGRVCGFVRLAGCNLACAWCDTTYAWKPGEMWRPLRHTVPEVLAAVAELGSSLVEVTGGEPLLQAATPALLSALCDAGYEVVLNTSGSLSIEGTDPRVRIALDLKCPASRQSDKMLWTNLDFLRPERDEIKFVVADRADYEWAREVGQRYGLLERFEITWSPVAPLDFDGDMASWPLPAELASWLVAERCPGRLGVQLHRLLWPAARHGVEEQGRGTSS